MFLKARKLLFCLAASLFASLILSASASALQLTELTPSFADDAAIELNTPAEDLDFDATLLDKNQTLIYTAEITNDESKSVEITAINLTTSTYDFLGYSYENLTVGDVLKPNETRTVTLYIKSNGKNTQTVDEDFNFSVNYKKYTPNKPSDQPTDPDDDAEDPNGPEDPNSNIPSNPETGDSTNPNSPNTVDSLPIFVLIAILAFVALLFALKKHSKLRNLVIAFAIPALSVFALTHNTSAAGEATFSIRGKVHFINVYTVTINPNNGSYNDKTEPTIASYRDGTTAQISNPSRETYNFTGWTIEPDTEIINNELTVTADTTLTANWEEIFYNLTIDPNGGDYAGHTAEFSEPYRMGQTVNLATPTKEHYSFSHWELEDQSSLNGSSVEITRDIKLVAQYDIDTFMITVNPNGGSFKNSTNTYNQTVDYGTVVDLTSIARQDYELKFWTKNTDETLEASVESVTVTEDIALTANWWSSIFHTVTINPNGGSYNNKTTNTETSVRKGLDYTLEGEPSREGYLFLGWILEDDSDLPNTTFTVERDVEIRANWMFIAARNERTGKLYSSITNADAEAQNGDTITVLADFEERAHTTHNITLDLNEHTITGYLINDGEIILLNGEINSSEITADDTNPDRAAIINNGKLTLGIDDYEDDEDHVKSALVDNNYVRLVGGELGLKQNGELYYYDGFIEGEIALQGGYNDSPWYRDTFDGVTVRHFPFVDRNNIRNCQHIILENSDRAVSKTVDNGEIYYYNLQDNINTSILTGYKIYAVRDFDAGYTINVPANTSTVIDIAGYNITINDTITIDGDLQIEDSSTTIATAENTDNITHPSFDDAHIVTPHGDTITTIDYAGLISVPQTIINNGSFTIKNARITGTTNNDTIQNYGNLSLQNGVLSARTGYVSQTIAGSTYNLDDNSYLLSTSTSKSTLYNTLSEFTWNSGNIASIYLGVHNTSGAKFIMNGGSVIVNNPSNAVTVRGIYNQGETEVNGGKILITSATTTSYTCESTISHCTYGIYGNATVANGSLISIKTTGATPTYGVSGTSTIENSSIILDAYGRAYGTSGATTITGSNITTSSANSQASGVYSANATITNSNITASAKKTQAAYGVQASSSVSTFNIDSGNINVTTENGAAYGIGGSCSSSASSCTHAIVANGSITASSTGAAAYGAYLPSYSASKYAYAEISSGTIKAESETSSSYGINGSGNIITGGKIQGGTYGIYGNGTAPSVIGNASNSINIESPEIIGEDHALYEGAIYFYDGVLRGEHAYQDGIIKAIPDGATYHNESSDAYDDNCWLVEAEDYLQVGSDTFNSLALAYNALSETNNTIKVIKDAEIEALLPDSPAKTIIFDLNGHSLSYTQTMHISEETDMTIIDSDPNKAGIFKNTNASLVAIANDGILTINGATIDAQYYAISNTNALAISDSTLRSPATTIYSKGVNTKHATVNINHSTIESGTDCLDNYSYSDAVVKNSTLSSTNDESSSKTMYGAYNYSSNSSLTLDNTSLTVYSITTTSHTCESTISHCTYGIYGPATVTNGSSITVTTTGASPTYGISGSNTLTNSSITIDAYGRAYGTGSTTTATNSDITVSSANSQASGIYASTATFNSGNISVTAAKTNAAYGIQTSGSAANITVNGGNVNATTQNGAAYGISGNCGSSASYCLRAVVTGGHISANSTGAAAYGVYAPSYSASKYGSVQMSAGLIEAESETSTAYGIHGSGNIITGGKVQGGNYGIYGNSAAPTIIGDASNGINIETPEIIGEEYALYEGAVYFYDGVLRGEHAYQDEVIKAIPDGAAYHVESSDDYDENCWLIEAEDYLQVGEETFNSLALAYNALSDTDNTIKVIKDITVEALLPESPARTIIFDLNGHDLTYTQTLTVSVGTNMTLTDSDPNKAGILRNSNPNLPIFTNNGTLTIDNTSLAAAQRLVNNAGTLTINDSEMEAVSYGIYSAGTKTDLATVDINNSSITSKHIALYNYSYSNTTVDDSNLIVNNDDSTAKTVYGAYNYSSNATLEITHSNIDVDTITTTSHSCESTISHCTYGVGGPSTISDHSIITVNGTGASPTYGISGTTTLSDSDITINTYGRAYGTNGAVTITNANLDITSTNNQASGIYSANSVITDSTITAKSSAANQAYGIQASSNAARFTITDSAISSTAEKGASYGVYGGCSSSVSYCTQVTMNSGSISARSTDGIAYGFYGPAYSTSKYSYINMTTGTVEGVSETNTGYGIYSSGSTVADGSVTGSTYGIYGVNTAITTIGTDDGEVSTQNPSITGGDYAVYASATNFYDGVLRGSVKAYQEGSIKTIDGGSTIHTETQNVDSKDYIARYLIPEGDVAQIGTTRYQKLVDAIGAAEIGDTIDLIADNFVFAPFEIAAEKDITIKTNGFNIFTGHPLVNNGKVTLVNNGDQPTTLEYGPNEYLIKNNADGELSLQNFKIVSTYGVQNLGTLTLDNIEIDASNTALRNSGNVTADHDIVLTGTSYPIYSDGGTSVINDATLTGNEIYNEAGSLTLSNGQSERNAVNTRRYVTNSGKLILKDFDLTFTNTGPTSSASGTAGYASAIYNTGELEILNHSNVSHIVTTETNYNITNHATAIHNDGGSVKVNDSTITADSRTARSNYGRTTYGIYSPTGSVAVESGTIDAYGMSTTYGIWNVSGNVTLGIPEPTDSVNYGGEHADVSTTDPAINAITSANNGTGIGIKNDTGKVFFYDGKITASSAAMPENPSGVEYLYEPKDYTDQDGHQYRVLEWMREQPGIQP